jgi:hypothetical protein
MLNISMARTIQSPGVEIREIDLTLSPVIPVGTNIFLAGYCNKGPTDEVTQITSVEELEQVYGTPTNPAERYFYYTARQVLNGSSGNLYVNRLPYGKGVGEGYGSKYGALVYPIVSVTQNENVNVYRNVSKIPSTYFSNFGPTQINIINSSGLSSEFASLTANGLNTYKKFSLVDGTALKGALESYRDAVGTSNPTLSTQVQISINDIVQGYDTSVTYNYNTTTGTLVLGAPRYFELTSDEYRSILDKSAFTNTNYSWAASGRNVYPNPLNSSENYINSIADFGYAGLIIINKIQSTINGKYEGHYVGITDNFNIEPNSPHESVKSIYSIGSSVAGTGFLMTGSGLNPSYAVPTAKLDFPLISNDSVGQRNNKSLSEALERIGYGFADISTNKFDDSICLGIFKLRVSPYTTDALKLDYASDGSYLGSVDSFRVLNSQNGGVAQSFFLESTTSKSSVVSVMINDYISMKSGSQSNLDVNGIPKRKFRVLSNYKIKSLIEEKENNFAKVGFHLNDVALNASNEVDTFGGSGMKLNTTTSTATSNSGSFTISVASATGWAVGDSLEIKHSDDSKTMTTTIAGINGLTITLTDALNYQRVSGSVINNKSSNYYKIFFQPADALFGNGSYSGDSAAAKEIGNVPFKLDRTLRKIENDEIFDLDLVLEGGLGTIHASVCANEVDYYDDTQYSLGILQGLNSITKNEPTTVSSPQYDIVSNYNTVFNVFENFASQIRRDCMFIADPIRHIFVTGLNTLTLSDHNKSFSQYIYNPLKHLFAGANSSYVCTYGNWAKINDLFTGTPTWLPMSGYIAADIANVDKNFEPWYAPAGFTRGKITNILSLAITPKQKERDMLYKISVNPIAFFPNDGFNIFGQKTMLRQPSAFDRINVRRLFLYLQKATKRTTKYFIMEPNTVYTRSRVVATLEPIFERAKNTQGLYDYQIICDTRNNTPSVIDQNEMVVDIYLKPVRTAEFILVNFYATSTGTNFNEIIGA